MSLKKSIKNVGLLIVVLFIFSGVAQAATITVPDDYAKIQWAIDNATTGDTVFVKSGIYYETLNINKQLYLSGIDTGSGKPVVDASGSGTAIMLSVDGITLDGFTAINSGSSSSEAGIKVLSDDNILKYNDASSNLFNGIYLSSSSSNNTLISNNASNNRKSGSGTGIYISGSINTLIKNNASNNSFYNIVVYGSNNNLTENIANYSSWEGITLLGSGNLLISNTISFNTRAIFVNSEYNTLIRNNINSNQEGLRLDSSKNIVSGNNINSNAKYGLLLYGSDNMLIDNNLTFNNYGGISICSANNMNNTIYNNFFFNTNNLGTCASVMKINTWNMTKTVGTNIIGGSYLGGNVWANPSDTGFSQTCEDADGDGICDSPYVFDVNNTDFLPLAYSIGIHTNSIGYSAVVATGQNTIVESSDGSFGPLMKGETKTITDSVVLNNTGDLSAKVEARMNDSIGGVFGLINGTNLLNATNFKLGPSGPLVPLLDNGDDVLVATAPPGVTALDARLEVPSDAVAGDYTGTVVLTFSNDV